MVKKKWHEEIWGKAFILFALATGVGATMTTLGLGTVQNILTILNPGVLTLNFVVGAVLSALIVIASFAMIADGHAKHKFALAAIWTVVAWVIAFVATFLLTGALQSTGAWGLALGGYILSYVGYLVALYGDEEKLI
jgi:hypothetical protein